MAKAITCASCGAKFRAHRDRCPRCRSVIVAPNPVAEAASNRRLSHIATGIVALVIGCVGFLWITRDAGPAPPAIERRPAAAAPTPAPPSSDVATGPSNHRPGVALLDPSGEATIAYHAGDYETSLAQFQAAVQKNPNDAESLSNLGQVLVKLGRVPEAIPHLERATALNPDRWAYRFNLARALGLLERWDESIASYQQAQRLFPDDYVTTFNLALAFHRAGNEAAAVDQYRRAIALQPDDPSFRIALGISYERLQKPAEAIAAYSEYLRLAPSGAEADKVRARIAELSDPASRPPAAPAADRGTSND